MTPEQRAHKLTDDAITALERRISVVYKQANKDVTEKLNTYMERFKRLDEQKLKQVTDGVLSQADYKQWRVGKIAIGENWKAIQNNLAQDYVNADKIAASIINGDMANVYALNHNYAAYALESETNMNLQFTLYDKSTVEGLLKENKNLLPQRKIDVPKDLRWNKQKIQSAVTQGILQGEPIDKIANRLQQVTDMNHNAAVRNARTAATGAENAGRQDTYNEAVSKGIKLKKEWLATLDSRTRDAHQQLDGQRVEEDKPFKSEFGDIMYPGDPSADPANVYNCRCTMIAVVDGVEDVEPVYRRDNISGEKIDNMTYSDWENSKKNDITRVEGESHVYKKEDYKSAQKLVQDVTDDMQYENYGFRVQDVDTENLGKKMSHISKNFGDDFGVSAEKGEELSGVSALGINNIGQIGSGGYSGKTLYLLGSANKEYGYDAGEIIMKDPVVLAKMKYENGKIELIEKVSVEISEDTAKTIIEQTAIEQASESMEEYIKYKVTIIEKYGEENMWRNMTDAEMDLFDNLERKAYKG